MTKPEKKEEMNYFEVLNNVNVSDKIEKKNGLSYLSWAYAWAELKKRHPDATYKVYKNEQGWLYHTDGKTGWVETGVTICSLEHIETLPIMDYKNQSIPVDKITSMNVNTSIQRSLTKAIARHGLGLYIYAGEDLPEDAPNFSMGYDDEQNKQAYDQALAKIDTFQTVDEIENYYKKEKNRLNKLPKELYDDILAQCAKRKTNLLDKVNF